MTIVSVDEVTNTSLPIVVCVSPDPMVRERLARQLDGRGVVVMCPDLPALRALLSGGNTSLLQGAPAPAAEVIPGVVTSEELRPELTIDAPDHRIRWRGEPLPLTRLECELVARLGTEPVRLWTYERLFAAVWGGAYLGDNSILHSAVKRLRRKLKAVDAGLGIETVRGIGYRLVTP